MTCKRFVYERVIKTDYRTIPPTETSHAVRYRDVHGEGCDKNCTPIETPWPAGEPWTGGAEAPLPVTPARATEWRPLNVTVGLHIEQRDDGGIRILTSVPGAYLSGRDPAKVFADLGAVLQKCLIENEHHLWCGAAPLDGTAKLT